MAAGPAALGRARRPQAPERRWRAAGPDRRVARPAPAAPPTSPGRKGPASPLRSRRRRGPPPQDTSRPPLPSLRRSPHVGPAFPTARTFRPGHRLASRPSPAAPAPDSARDPTTLASAAPASRNEPCGSQPGVRRGRALRWTKVAHCSNRRGARLRARRSSTVGQRLGGGTLRRMKLDHWSETKRGGTTHVGPKSATFRQGAVPGVGLL